MLSLAGMTAYAGGHLHNAAAPLQPAAAAAAAPASAATSTATTTTTTTTTGRLQLSHRDWLFLGAGATLVIAAGLIGLIVAYALKSP